MKNLSISLENRPGTLARVGEVLGQAGVSIEGGGMFVVEDNGVANFLVSDGAAAHAALASAGITVLHEDDVVMLRLDQDEAGQLGRLLRRMAEAGVNVLTQYSDHDRQLVLIVDDLSRGRAVADAWMHERSQKRFARRTRTHRYAAKVTWMGNTGSGTASYTGYGRNHDISSEGKRTIEGSSDPAFRGENTRYNPEELLVASASACHMLSYLHLCAIHGVVVLSYEDNPTGEMEEVVGGVGAFVRVDLHPVITVADTSDRRRAESLHHEAHENCFIANSLKVPVYTHPKIIAGSDIHSSATIL